MQTSELSAVPAIASSELCDRPVAELNLATLLVALCWWGGGGGVMVVVVVVKPSVL